MKMFLLTMMVLCLSGIVLADEAHEHKFIDLEVTHMREESPNQQYSGWTRIEIGQDTTSFPFPPYNRGRRGLLRSIGLVDSMANATVIGSALIRLKLKENFGLTETDSIEVWAVMESRPWVLDEATWNEWDDGESWTTAGCYSTASDYYAVRLDVESIRDTTANRRVSLSIFTAIDSLINGSWTDLSFLIAMQNDDEGLDRWAEFYDETGDSMSYIDVQWLAAVPEITTIDALHNESGAGKLHTPAGPSVLHKP